MAWDSQPWDALACPWWINVSAGGLIKAMFQANLSEVLWRYHTMHFPWALL